MPNIYNEINDFLGIKNDEDIKEISPSYFWNIKNFNFQTIGLSGLEKIAMPKRISQLGNTYIDGMFEYRYLNSNNKLITEEIGICNGKVYKNILSTPVEISSGLSLGLCNFGVLNDVLYIANGKDYVWKYDGINGVVTQMGAPTAIKDGLGILNGNYYYAITQVLSSGEEYMGSVSNTLSLVNNKVLLNIPIGKTSVISRNIYRTTANGTTLKLLASITDNTTLTYEDNISDSSLGVQIIDINNEMPKPYFISVYNERLIGAKIDLYPTQIFISESEKDYFDVAEDALDIANYSDDNSPVTALGIDFSNLMVATLKHWYLVTINSSGAINVTTTRVNIGCKNGYSVVRIPTFGDFTGGLMFVSTNNDVRILNGLRAIPVATSVDNISSDIFSQNIQGTLTDALNAATNIYAEYFEYKYHLVVDGNKFVFDIRLKGWTYHNIQSENYKSNPIFLAIFNNFLYNGQDDGWIEKEYYDIKYRGEEVPAIIESVELNVFKDNNWFQKLVFWLTPSEYNKMKVSAILNDNIYFAKTDEFSFVAGAYDVTNYSETEYAIYGKNINNSRISNDTDYRVFNINEPVRWLRWTLNIKEGNLILRKWGYIIKQITGK